MTVSTTRRTLAPRYDNYDNRFDTWNFYVLFVFVFVTKRAVVLAVVRFYIQEQLDA